MSDIIYYKNGEKTFRISPPTVGTKCPETKLEVKKMNEIEKTEGEIKVLQAKLELLKEMENHKTPCEIAYKRVYGFYPETYEDSWSSFQDGYIASQKDYKVGEYQEPEEELKTLFQMLNDKNNHPETCAFVCNIVKRWMSQYTHNVMTGEYLKGYEECLTVLEENLK
jgi:hypothetical protein